MLFLMNDVVFNLAGLALPKGLAGRSFGALPFNLVSRLGQELYAESPLLHYRRPERARRLALLVMSKAPAINAALFTAPDFGCDPSQVTMRYRNVDLETVLEFYQHQSQDGLDTIRLDRLVWRRLAA